MKISTGVGLNLCTPPASGYNWASVTLKQTLVHAGAIAGDHLGQQVSFDIANNIIIAGCHRIDNGATGDAGKMFNFNTSGTAVQTLVSPNPAVNGYYGYCMGYDRVNGRVIVGSHEFTAGNGHAYIYTNSGGTLTYEATISETTVHASQTADRFAADQVVLYGNVAVVTERLDDTGSADRGAVHIWRRSGGTWGYSQTLQASDAQTSDAFGMSCDIIDGLLVVGAWGEDTGASNAGSLYVYKDNGTTFASEQILRNPNGASAASERLGLAVAFSPDQKYIAGGAGTGMKVYMFINNGSDSFSHVQTITGPDTAGFSNFGVRVCFASETVLTITDTEHDHNLGGAQIRRGRAYIYELIGSTWTYRSTLQHPSPATEDTFGSGAAAGNGWIAIGCENDETSRGTVFLFQAAN